MSAQAKRLVGDVLTAEFYADRLREVSGAMRGIEDVRLALDDLGFPANPDNASAAITLDDVGRLSTFLLMTSVELSDAAEQQREAEETLREMQFRCHEQRVDR